MPEAQNASGTLRFYFRFIFSVFLKGILGESAKRDVLL